MSVSPRLFRVHFIWHHIYQKRDTTNYEHLTKLFVIENNEKEQKIAFDYVVTWKTGKQFQTLVCFLPYEGFMCYGYEKIP